jgi:3-oxoacyl-[acyl-carrier-protein] synthase-3
VAELTLKHTAVKAIYTVVPKTIYKTIDYPFFSDDEAKMFSKTTGIIERRVANADVTASDLCYQAADALLEELNCRNEIDLLVFVTQSPDYFLPASAAILQDKLGLPTTCMAFDVNLGCSGYVHGLLLANRYLQNGGLKKVLLLAGDKSTISTHEKDKTTFPLFGDAGSATLIEFDPNAEDWHLDAGTDGSGADSIIIPGGHSRNPYGTFDDSDFTIAPGLTRSLKHLHLDGMEVFNFALKNVPTSLKNVLNKADLSLDEVDYCILHQANQLITDSIRKKLKSSTEKFPTSIQQYGNTSSASIPLTICSELKEQLSTQKLKLLISGFGVGFSWATLLLNTEGVQTKLLEYE